MNDEAGENPLFDTNSVSYGAAGLQQLLILQGKDMMLRRWLHLLDQQDGSGGRLRALRAFQSSVKVLYEELRPRMVSKQAETKKGEGYDYAPSVLDGLVNEKPEELMRKLLEYLELDLKLTKLDMKQEYNTMSAWRKQGFGG